MPGVVTDEVGDVESNLDIVTIPEEVKKYAKEVLGESPETILTTTNELRDIIYERGEVTPLRMDDAYLLRFLRSRKFKVESAYNLLVNYGNFRQNYQHFYEDVNPLDLGFIGDRDIVSVLPYREQNGRRIMIYKLGKWNPNEFDIDEIFKASLAILEVGVLEPRAQILGGVVVFDFSGVSIQHAWKITPSVASTVVDLMMTSFPMKTAYIHVVNESWVFDIILNIFKPLVGKRYREIMSFHGNNMASLHKHINPKYLPKTYGGIRPDYSYKDWFDSLKQNKEIVNEMKQLGYREPDPSKEPSTS